MAGPSDARATAARQLIEIAVDCGALTFGDYTLKSGRPSPYFMDIGKIATAVGSSRLGELYAERICALATGGNLLGLPYKGIPLAALACAATQGCNPESTFSYGYLRKEPKDHGEGGVLVGQLAQEGPVIIIDDVLTAGTAVIDACAQLRTLGIKPAKLVVAFDRQERVSDTDPRAAAHKITATTGIEVVSIATATDFLAIAPGPLADRIQDHLALYAPQAS